MKYIDADKLIAEIKGIVADVQVKERPDVFGSLEQCLAASEIEALNLVIETINELQQEQPSLPSNLNEAAVQFARRAYSPFDDPYEVSRAFQNDVNCFKAGAEWMAGQGYTQEGIAHLDDCEVWVDIKNTDIKDGDKVIVQIRKNDQ